MKPEYPKPDPRPDDEKAPRKRRLKLVDGTVVTIHPDNGRKLRGFSPCLKL